jgi:hypothetical protein
MRALRSKILHVHGPEGRKVQRNTLNEEIVFPDPGNQTPQGSEILAACFEALLAVLTLGLNGETREFVAAFLSIGELIH